MICISQSTYSLVMLIAVVGIGSVIYFRLPRVHPYMMRISYLLLGITLFTSAIFVIETNQRSFINLTLVIFSAILSVEYLCCAILFHAVKEKFPFMRA